LHSLSFKQQRDTSHQVEYTSSINLFPYSYSLPERAMLHLVHLRCSVWGAKLLRALLFLSALSLLDGPSKVGGDGRREIPDRPDRFFRDSRSDLVKELRVVGPANAESAREPLGLLTEVADRLDVLKVLGNDERIGDGPRLEKEVSVAKSKEADVLVGERVSEGDLASIEDAGARLRRHTTERKSAPAERGICQMGPKRRNDAT
jgi:hypothetical protein